jgi:hypothetical protein
VGVKQSKHKKLSLLQKREYQKGRELENKEKI